MSRNPFLQTFEAEFNKEAKLIDMNATLKDSPKKASFGDEVGDLFVRPCSLSQSHCAALHQRAVTVLYRNPPATTYPHDAASNGPLQALYEQVC